MTSVSTGLDVAVSADVEEMPGPWVVVRTTCVDGVWQAWLRRVWRSEALQHQRVIAVGEDGSVSIHDRMETDCAADVAVTWAADLEADVSRVPADDGLWASRDVLLLAADGDATDATVRRAQLSCARCDPSDPAPAVQAATWAPSVDTIGPARRAALHVLRVDLRHPEVSSAARPSAAAVVASRGA